MNLDKILAAAALFIGCVYAETYYVSKDGNDGNDGSSTSPFETINFAATQLNPGDVVRVREGIYEERVTTSVDGSAGQYVNFLAVGNVVVRGFLVTGSYTRVIGFEITHEEDVGYDGIDVEDADYVELLHNDIHNISGVAIDPDGANFLTIRGNIMNYSGSPGDNFGPGTKSINDWGTPCNYILIEYNIISHTSDYIGSNGDFYIARNNVLGPTTVDDFGGGRHVDGWQANSQTRWGFMESNWHIDNSITDAHMILIAAPVTGVNGHFAVMKNVSLRSGDHLWFQMRDGDDNHAAHNSVGQVGYGPRGGPGSAGFFYVFSQNTPSLDNYSYNNIFYNVTRRTVYTVDPENELTHGYDHTDVGEDLSHGENGNIISNPVEVSWVDYSANNLLLKNSAPDIDKARPLTQVSEGSGSGTSFSVENPDWFYDGFDLTRGQSIYVGDDNDLIIQEIDYGTGEITVNRAIQWQNGDGVGYAYRGDGPDLGAYEHGDRLLTSSQIMLDEDSGEDVVINDGDVRFVVFYRDGIPIAEDYEAPYTHPADEESELTAKVFARHAQEQPFFDAVRVPPGTNPIHESKRPEINQPKLVSEPGLLHILAPEGEALTSLRVFNIQGREQRTLNFEGVDRHRLEGLESGVYFLETGLSQSGKAFMKAIIP